MATRLVRDDASPLASAFFVCEGGEKRIPTNKWKNLRRREKNPATNKQWKILRVQSSHKHWCIVYQFSLSSLLFSVSLSTLLILIRWNLVESIFLIRRLIHGCIGSRRFNLRYMSDFKFQAAVVATLVQTPHSKNGIRMYRATIHLLLLWQDPVILI